MRDDGSLDYGGRCRGGEKCESVLKLELERLVDGWYIRYERKRGVKEECKV